MVRKVAPATGEQERGIRWRALERKPRTKLRNFFDDVAKIIQDGQTAIISYADPFDPNESPHDDQSRARTYLKKHHNLDVETSIFPNGDEDYLALAIRKYDPKNREFRSRTELLTLANEITKSGSVPKATMDKIKRIVNNTP